MQLAKSAKISTSTGLNRLKKDFSKHKYLYFMAIPVILYYIIFHYIPLGGLLIAFENYSPRKGIFGSTWVGFKHFYDFLRSYNALRVIRNTLAINVYEILFGFPAPILLALLMNEIKSNIYKRFVQTISYMPHFISLVVICGIITDFVSSTGIINDFVELMGGERTNFLMQKEMFRTVFVTSGIWQHVGWGSIIYLATLSGIDPQLYEAATIDGAGRFKQLIHITIPALIPTITILLIMRLGHIMSQGFEKIILLYNPLTYETADVISSYVYRRGLQETDYSFGAAVGLFNSVANYIILVTANYLSRKYVKESLW